METILTMTLAGSFSAGSTGTPGEFDFSDPENSNLIFEELLDEFFM